MASTADCKKFLGDFHRRNPQIMRAIFGNGCDQTLLQMVADSKNWKRSYKCNPGKGRYEFDEYCLFVDGCQLNRWGDASPIVRRPTSDFVSERGFDCDPLNGQVAYVVLEDTEGNLHLSNYIGD